MLTVACVLRSGGAYDARYVARLLAGVRRNLGIPFRFMCLTDMMADCLDAIPELENIPDGACQDQTGTFAMKLEHDWPGWWAKMELFRLPGPLLYFDLDTVIVGDVTPLALTVIGSAGCIVGTRDFNSGLLQSNILGWGDGWTILFSKFKQHAREARWENGKLSSSMTVTGRWFRSDQEWLRMAMTTYGIPLRFVQDCVPGIYSAKNDIHARHGGKLPDDARIVCFHGHPRPAELVPAPAWLREHWGTDE